MRAVLLLLLATGVISAPSTAVSQRFTGKSPARGLPTPVMLFNADEFSHSLAGIGDDLFISGQPDEAGLRRMHDLGVTTIVNLRTPEEMRTVPFDEPALAARLGMTYVFLPSGDTDHPFDPGTVTQFSDALGRTKGKVLLHCAVGWRARHLWAAYLIKERGTSVDSALANARALGPMTRDTNKPAPVEQYLGRELPELRVPSAGRRTAAP
ncbi:MAG TPA: sulfur transferase domain-containing protein [Gemmatimonadaceae bacterium]|nr:sulfur transferase domain-containing protein [Gemmatimonadaceae bacterium]